MTVIELDDDLAAALKAKADAHHLKLEDWFRTLTDVPAGNDSARAVEYALKLPAVPLGNVGSLHRRDIYDDAP
jgi:plasmid stability protein